MWSGAPVPGPPRPSGVVMSLVDIVSGNKKLSQSEIEEIIRRQANGEVLFDDLERLSGDLVRRTG